MLISKKRIVAVFLIIISAAAPLSLIHYRNTTKQATSKLVTHSVSNNQQSHQERHVAQFISTNQSSTANSFRKLQDEVGTTNARVDLISNSNKPWLSFDFIIKYSCFSSFGLKVSEYQKKVQANSNFNGVSSSVDVGLNLFTHMQVKVLAPDQTFSDLQLDNFTKPDLTKIDISSLHYAVKASGNKTTAKVELLEEYLLRGSDRTVQVKTVGHFLVMNAKNDVGHFLISSVFGVMLLTVLCCIALAILAKIAYWSVGKLAAGMTKSAVESAASGLAVDEEEELTGSVLKNSLEDSFTGTSSDEGSKLDDPITDELKGNVPSDGNTGESVGGQLKARSELDGASDRVDNSGEQQMEPKATENSIQKAGEDGLLPNADAANTSTIQAEVHPSVDGIGGLSKDKEAFSKNLEKFTGPTLESNTEDSALITPATPAVGSAKVVVSLDESVGEAESKVASDSMSEADEEGASNKISDNVKLEKENKSGEEAADGEKKLSSKEQKKADKKNAKQQKTDQKAAKKAEKKIADAASWAAQKANFNLRYIVKTHKFLILMFVLVAVAVALGVTEFEFNKRGH